MTIINYTETELGRGEKLISWSGLTGGDRGSNFKLVGYTIKSIHQYKPNGGSVSARMEQSDKLDGSSSIPTGSFSASSNEIFLGSVFGIQSLWIFPVAISGSDLINIDMLVKEV